MSVSDKAIHILNLEDVLLDAIISAPNTSIDIIEEYFKAYKEKHNKNNTGWSSYSWRFFYTLSTASKLLPEHIDFFIENRVFHLVINRSEIEERHIDRLLSSHWCGASTVAKRRNLSIKHIDMIVKNDRYSARAAIAVHPNLLPEHVDILLKDKTLTVLRSVAKREDLKPHHVQTLLSKRDYKGRVDIRIRQNLIKNNYITHN